MANQLIVPDAQHGDGHAHPSQGTYVKVAAFLAAITAIEVAIYYIDTFAATLVPALVILSAIKFIVVVGYFMHLKFDSRVLAFTFASALIISLAVYIGTWLMQNHARVVQFTQDMSI